MLEARPGRPTRIDVEGLVPRQLYKVRGRGTRPYRFHYATENSQGVVHCTLYGPFLKSGKRSDGPQGFIAATPDKVTRWP